MQRTWVLISLGLALLFSSPIAAQERITSFDSRIVVDKDASLTVTETIDVVANGDQIRHGIYRDFPTKYRGGFGKVVTVGFKVIKILRDGQAEPYSIANRQNAKRIYIGDPNAYVDAGAHEYTIVYQTTRHLGFFSDQDDLYWNVTGNEWAFHIDKVTAEVILPSDVPVTKITADSYTGASGSESTMAKYTIGPGSPSVSFRTTEGLEANEGLTIDVGFPKGFVRPPSSADKFLYVFQDNIGSIMGVFGLVVLLAYYGITWARVGNDPEKGTIVPQWEIPDGLSPAAIRFVRRMGFDSKAFGAAVLNMAVKRYVRIVQKKHEYTIEKDKADPSVLAPEEQKGVDSLLGASDNITLKDTNHSRIASALAALNVELDNRYRKQYFSRNTGWGCLGFIASVGIVILMALLVGNMVPGIVVVFAVLLLIVNVVFFPLMRCVTIPGRRLLDKIEGLRMYLTTAEQDRLNTLNPPERTPQLFEKFLPYALALDVEQQWSEQFTEILAKAGEGGAAYSPSWYSGTSSWSDLGSGRFASAVGSSLAGAIASSSVAPGSSSGGGGGGGGSSGGGGGGGGGGGW
jgi:uncharacterized membrane protein YgcG